MNEKLANSLKEIASLATCNPFSPERFAIEKKILKRSCEPFDSVAWNRKKENREGDRPNVLQLKDRVADVVNEVCKLDSLPEAVREDYWNAATYLLLYQHIAHLKVDQFGSKSRQSQKQIAETWENFWLDYQEIFAVGGFSIDKKSAAHLFACLSQIHRAFFHIFDYILGQSLPIAKLREQVWESIFTFSINQYHDRLYSKMRDLSTLVTGPSGTGKELVARAIGLSQYASFNHGTCLFEYDPDSMFLPLNLTALSPTLIESELFGHRKGAFTGAVADRVGWLEACSENGAVFLDEIGELDVSLQVKLLRVLQQRTYCRLGETTERTFAGKIIAATNRNLEEEIKAFRFREDFYFRICSDRIQTPSLRQQLDDRPEDLSWLVESIVEKQLGTEAESVANEIGSWINTNLGEDYPWHGNIRELEQCVRSCIVHRHYEPVGIAKPLAAANVPAWLNDVVNRKSTADELLRNYCTWVYAKQGSYEKTSKVLNIDRRTVRSKVDPELLKEFKSD